MTGNDQRIPAKKISRQRKITRDFQRNYKIKRLSPQLFKKGDFVGFYSSVIKMSFLCQICGKAFTARSNLYRHQKSHSQSTTTYSCSICGKEFNRPDNRKKHEKTHSNTFSCPVCGQYFNREDSMLRHKLIHDAPNKKPRINMKRPASPEPGPSHVQSPPKRQRTISEQPDILPEDPDTRTLYLRHWDDIRTRENTGNRVQDRFNYTLHDLNITQFGDMAHHIFQQQTTAFRINLSFGFILRNHETGDLRYYHPSQNNARFFDVPHLIRNEEDLQRFLDELSRQDVLEYIRLQRPDTKWVVHLLTNVTFYVNKINDYPIGAGIYLPDYVLKNPGLNALTSGSHGPYKDILCLFRCLAVHRGAPVKDVETPAKTYFQQYIQHTSMSPHKFKGVTLEDLHLIEKRFEINIFVYELKEDDETGNHFAELVRRSPCRYNSTMYLNLFANHFSYIKDLKVYCKSFSCSKCGKLWKSCYMMIRHESTCEAKVRYTYPGGVYHPKPSIFEKLEEFDIDIPDELKYYPYRATYDIEAMLQPTDKPKTKKLEWTSTHVPLSISVCSNIPNRDRPICFVSNGDINSMISNTVQYLNTLSREAYQLLVVEYDDIFNEMDEKMTEHLDPNDDKFEYKKKKHPLYKLQLQLEGYLHELPVIGFNSGKYDLNAMKIDFFSHLVEHDNVKFVVKKNNNYMCVKTEELKFLDITNYLAPGFSYSQFLKAYGCTEEKGFFPYEWMDSLEKLKDTELPPHAAFHSSLKNENITKDEYEYCQHIFNENNMTTMKDFLIWYNNKDVVPMLEAIDKMFVYYKNQNLDMFKDGISVPGLTLKYMFQGLPNYFTIADKRNADLYRLFKDNIVGGPSIVFHRYHEAEKTFIRPTEYTDPKLCKSVIGFDANALYLWSIMQDMPTGHFVRRQSEDGFKRQTSRRFECMAIQWLEWEAKQSGNLIRHNGNNTEKRIGKYPVDGFCKQTNTVYQFDGCLFHGHSCELTHNRTVNPVNGTMLTTLSQQTEERNRYITKAGHQLKVMRECQWKKLIRDNPELQIFINSMKRPCDNKYQMTQDQIIEAVRENKLFGALEVDIHVPDHLKQKFAEMTPIFKNVTISREDIGDHMKKYAEERGMMSQPRTSLIGSMFGEKILIITPLLKWYLAHGLIVTKIHQVVEYTPSKCFEKLGQQISDARRAGDADPDKKIIAETNKLTGNSMYGTTATNKEKHRKIAFCSENTVSRCINNPFFRRCNQLNDDTFEIEMSKRVINMDLPLHIACFVYQYAKLRMLEFYFDFVDEFIDRKDFQYCSMDTDSAYMALSSTTIEDIIKPALRHRYEEEKYLWFPREDTPEHAAYDKRTPGLFKIEYEGEGIIALCSKTYYCFGPNNKFSCKGINKRTNTITKDTYMDVLLSKKSGSGTNRGFRSINNSVFTYLQERAGFSYLYPKRKVLVDGISTSFLNI